MKPSPGKILVHVVIILALIGLGYYFRDTLVRAVFIVKEAIIPTQPCEKPILYSLGNFDKQFGISQAQFLNDIDTATKLWETAVGKDLFQYADKGSLKINLEFDDRQKTTIELQKVDTVIKTDKSAYNTLKAKYDSYAENYRQQKANLDTMLAQYESAKATYEKEVSYWNDRGGAPKSEFAKLERQRQDLNAQVVQLKQAQSTFNSLVDTLNATATELNALARKLNLNVNTYNTIGASNGEEFSEGEYVSDSKGQSINIYQFDDNAKLVRVLAHELGHSLGLDHVDNPEAIMYRLNQGSNSTLTTDDIAELKALCKIQ